MKHLLNDLTEKEKNSIREQHTGGMKVVTENFSKLINAKSGDVKPLVNEQGDFSDLENEFDDREFKDRAIKNVVQGEPHKPRRDPSEGSFNECEELINTMEFIYNDFMSQISELTDEMESEDAEDVYEDIETELGGILDEANQKECDDEIIYHLEILYNEYLSDIANKLGLR